MTKKALIFFLFASIRLLAAPLSDEAQKVSDHLALAEKLQLEGNDNQAISAYKNLIQQQENREEVWYAKWMLGELYEKNGFWDQALYWYLEAYQSDQTRAEPLQKIANHYRLGGQSSLAFLFANQASKIPLPKKNSFKLSLPVYTYQIDDELSIAAFYTPFKDEGMAAINRIMLRRDVPASTKNQARQNLLFYLKNLKTVASYPIKIDLPPVREGSTICYNASSPSIQKTNEGYELIVRTVNFAQQGAISYHSLDPEDPTIRTKNFFVTYDPQFNLMSQKEIIEELPRTRYPRSVQGLEDCRLFFLNQEHWFFATTMDTRPESIEQSLCQLDPETGLVKQLLPLKSPHSYRCEKNWLPFVHNNELCAIYGYDPHTLLKIDPTSGQVTPIVEYEPTHDFTTFRGSAAPIPFDDGYLALIHEMIFKNQRHYCHRFILLDKDYRIKKVSKPFTFMHLGIEYCCGMTTDHSNQNCLLTISFEDREAHLLVVALDDIRSLLEPLP